MRVTMFETLYSKQAYHMPIAKALKRIKEGGGFVEDGRVQGIIAVSRAIGDWEYKNPALA